MEDEYTMFDYRIRVNSRIQLMVRKPLGSLDNLPKKRESAGKEKAAVEEREGGGSRERQTGTQEAKGDGGAGASSPPAYRDDPLVSVEELLEDSQEEEVIQALDQE